MASPMLILLLFLPAAAEATCQTTLPTDGTLAMATQYHAGQYNTSSSAHVLSLSAPASSVYSPAYYLASGAFLKAPTTQCPQTCLTRLRAMGKPDARTDGPPNSIIMMADAGQSPPATNLLYTAYTTTVVPGEYLYCSNVAGTCGASTPLYLYYNAATDDYQVRGDKDTVDDVGSTMQNMGLPVCWTFPALATTTTSSSTGTNDTHSRLKRDANQSNATSGSGSDKNSMNNSLNQFKGAMKTRTLPNWYLGSGDRNDTDRFTRPTVSSGLRQSVGERSASISMEPANGTSSNGTESPGNRKNAPGSSGTAAKLFPGSGFKAFQSRLDFIEELRKKGSKGNESNLAENVEKGLSSLGIDLPSNGTSSELLETLGKNKSLTSLGIDLPSNVSASNLMQELGKNGPRGKDLKELLSGLGKNNGNETDKGRNEAKDAVSSALSSLGISLPRNTSVSDLLKELAKKESNGTKSSLAEKVEKGLTSLGISLPSNVSSSDVLKALGKNRIFASIGNTLGLGGNPADLLKKPGNKKDGESDGDFLDILNRSLSVLDDDDKNRNRNVTILEGDATRRPRVTDRARNQTRIPDWNRDGTEKPRDLTRNWTGATKERRDGTRGTRRPDWPGTMNPNGTRRPDWSPRGSQTPRNETKKPDWNVGTKNPNGTKRPDWIPNGTSNPRDGTGRPSGTMNRRNGTRPNPTNRPTDANDKEAFMKSVGEDTVVAVEKILKRLNSSLAETRPSFVEVNGPGEPLLLAEIPLPANLTAQELADARNETADVKNLRVFEDRLTVSTGDDGIRNQNGTRPPGTRNPNWTEGSKNPRDGTRRPDWSGGSMNPTGTRIPGTKYPTGTMSPGNQRLASVAKFSYEMNESKKNVTEPIQVSGNVKGSSTTTSSGSSTTTVTGSTTTSLLTGIGSTTTTTPYSGPATTTTTADPSVSVSSTTTTPPSGGGSSTTTTPYTGPPTISTTTASTTTTPPSVGGGSSTTTTPYTGPSTTSTTADPARSTTTVTGAFSTMTTPRPTTTTSPYVYAATTDTSGTYGPGDQKLDNGTVIRPNGDTIYPNGTVVTKDGTIIQDGKKIDPDGTVHNADGSTKYPNGTVTYPNGWTPPVAGGGGTSDDTPGWVIPAIIVGTLAIGMGAIGMIIFGVTSMMKGSPPTAVNPYAVPNAKEQWPNQRQPTPPSAELPPPVADPVTTAQPQSFGATQTLYGGPNPVYFG